ncbi:MAG: phage GP46 family protein [Pseudomonadota bacterium]
MFDVATRPQPSTVRGASVLRVPFDWRLAFPSAAAPYPWTDFSSPTGEPQGFVDQLATFALELEDTLNTGVIISLFTDGRADQDAKLPLNETDRRGWVGDEFMSEDATEGLDPWGNTLWMYYTGKVTEDIPGLVEFTCKESLAWLLRRGIASRIEVTASWGGEGLDRLLIRPQIYKPDQLTPVYDVLWGTSIRRAVA